jgi:hypothetical protein
VCIEVSDGLKILHSTSDILGIVEKEGQLEITLYGDRDLAGEIVFEGANVHKITSASIDGEVVKKLKLEKRVVFSYCHSHKQEITLFITLN